MKPGGFFYLAEFHPLAIAVCDEGGEVGDVLRMTFPYFPRPEPFYFGPGATYTNGDESTRTGNYEWPYNLGQVVSALCDAGLRIEFLHEQACTAFEMLPEMHKDEDGLWWREKNDLPLTFSIRARKEASLSMCISVYEREIGH